MSALYGSVYVVLICIIYCLAIGDSKSRLLRLKLCGVVSIVYMLSALIFSYSFDNEEFFMLNDPMTYIERTKSETLSFSASMNYVRSCYFDFADNNALYNMLLNFTGIFYKKNYDGVTAYSLALTSVLFGILSSITLFRIISRYFNDKKAYTYTLIFSILSLFHFYSVVVVRDVVVAFFYLLSIEIILKKRFTLVRLIMLIVIMLITWGVRLYSGLFLNLLILFYVYTSIKRSGAIMVLLIPLLLITIGLLIYSSSSVIERSVDEIDLYSEFTYERASESHGLIYRLLVLPPVIKQIALTLYSQITPFPPHLSLLSSNTFSQYYMSTMVIIYEVWWFSVSISLLYILFIKRTFFTLPNNDKLLILIAYAFIIANTAHPDIRRMMPVYPILYLFYLIFKYKIFDLEWFKFKQKQIMLAYISLLVLYVVLKG